MIALLAYIFYPFFFDLLRQMFKLNHDQVAPFVVKMFNFTDKKVNKEEWISSPFFAYEGGYQMCLRVDAAGYGDGEGTHVSVYLHLMKGPHDDKLEQSGHWPLRGTFTIELLNQFTDNDHYARSMLLSGYLCSECTNRVVEGDMATGVGFDQFISHDVIPDYVIEDVLQFRISYENNDDPLPVDLVAPLIMNMTKFTKRKKNKEQWYSSPFFAFDGGYLMCVHIYAAGYGDGEGIHVSVFLQLMKGPHDDKLEQSGHWPLRGTFIIELLNQLNDSDHCSHKIIMYDYLRSKCREREVEDYVNSIGHGCHQFVSHNKIFYKNYNEYLKNDILLFRIKYESINIPDYQVVPVTLVMSNFTEKMKDRKRWYSIPFFAFNGGYQMCLRVDAAGYYSNEDSHVSVLLYLMKGPHDNKLERSGHWPLRGTFTIELLNRLNDSDHFIFTISVYHYLCNQCTTRVIDSDIAPKGWGNKHFISRKTLLCHNENYFFNIDDLHFRISYEDTSSSTPHDQVAPVQFNMCNVTGKMMRNEDWPTVPFLAFNGGYRMFLILFMAGYNTGEDTHVSAYVCLMKGPHDDKLEELGYWPLRGTFIIELFDQIGDDDHHYHRIEIDSEKCSLCSNRVVKDNTATMAWGSHQFISKRVFLSDKYLKNDCVHLRICYEDIRYPVLHNHDQLAPVILRMDNVSENIRNNERWYSVSFLTFEGGYKLCLKVYGAGYGDGEGTHVSVFLCLMKGPHDTDLENSGHWPLRGTFIIELLNQLNDSDHYIRTVVVNRYLYSECTERVVWNDMARKCCHFKFVSYKTLFSKTNPLYLINDSLLFRISYEHNLLMSHKVAPVVLNILNFTKKLNRREHWNSSPFYAFEGGYQMCVSIDFGSNSNNKKLNNYISISVFLHLLRGPHDDKLQQPVSQSPLKGAFIVELMYHYGCDGFYHTKEIYFLSTETCRSCVTLIDDVAEGDGNEYIIPLKHFHNGLKNDEIYFNISYNTCYLVFIYGIGLWKS